MTHNDPIRTKRRPRDRRHNPVSYVKRPFDPTSIGLKIRFPQGSVGSSPSLGTNVFVMLQSRVLWVVARSFVESSVFFSAFAALPGILVFILALSPSLRISSEVPCEECDSLVSSTDARRLGRIVTCRSML